MSVVKWFGAFFYLSNGGFVAYVPDLPGCMLDVETPEEAVINVWDAIVCWMEAAEDQGHPISAPSRHLALAS